MRFSRVTPGTFLGLLSPAALIGQRFGHQCIILRYVHCNFLVLNMGKIFLHET